MESTVEVGSPAPPIRVLVVEDSPSDAFLLSQALSRLEPSGCAITQVTRLEEATERCRTRSFDVALLDLGLPDGNGLDTLLRFRAAAPDLPVVILTGMENEDLGLKALQSGAQDYLTKKGLDERMLVRTIRYAIERRRAEEMLRASEEQHRLFFEYSPLPMWAVDRQTFRFLAVNDAALRQYGYTREEFLRMTTADVRVPEERQRAGDESGAIGTLAPRPPGGPYLHRRKTGETMWVEASSRAFLLRGRPAWLTSARDVSERVKSAEERRRTETRFRALFESRIIATLVFDREGRILDANDFFLAMIGATREQLARGALRWDDLTPPEHLAADTSGLRRLRGEGEASPWEKEFIRADGVRVPVLLGATLLDAREGTTIAYAVDLTEKKRLEEHFRHSQKMEAIGNLAGGVSHDFNNLLTVINGYARLLADRLPAEDPSGEMAREILEAGERAAELTRHLLAFSRKQHLEPKLLELNAVIGSIEKTLGRMIGEDVELETRLDPALVTVRADPGQLEQILLNLAVNARDAMPHGGRLVITTSNVTLGTSAAVYDLKPGRYAQLAFADTGVGMDAYTRAHVFEPFFTTKPAGKGTGLGLATVYGVMKQSGGHITVESRPGAGATFLLLFPEASGEGAAPDERPEPPIPEARACETVLLVEDDQAVRRLARSLLEQRGYVVLPASDPDTALELAMRQPGRIDLLLCDVVLPRLSGPELGERIRALRPGLRVLYMSGHPDRAAQLLGASGYLKKPFTPDALARAVQAALA